MKKGLEMKIPSVVLLGEFQAWIKEYENYLENPRIKGKLE